MQFITTAANVSEHLQSSHLYFRRYGRILVWGQKPHHSAEGPRLGQNLSMRYGGQGSLRWRRSLLKTSKFCSSCSLITNTFSFFYSHFFNNKTTSGSEWVNEREKSKHETFHRPERNEEKHSDDACVSCDQPDDHSIVMENSGILGPWFMTRCFNAPVRISWHHRLTLGDWGMTVNTDLREVILVPAEPQHSATTRARRFRRFPWRSSALSASCEEE